MAVECPYPGCTYTIAEGTDPAVIAALLNGHMLVHSQANRAKPTPVSRPEISAGGTTEGWHYFLTRWRAYSLAVHLTDAEIPVQLLECLDPKLRKDGTWSAPHQLRGTPRRSCWQPSKLLLSGRRTPRWPGWLCPGWCKTEGSQSAHLQPDSVAKLKFVGSP